MTNSLSKLIRQYESNIYQPCSGSQLTCFLGFSIGNFMSIFVLSKRRGICSVGLQKHRENSQITRNSSPTSSAHHVFVDVGVNCRRNKRISKPHCLPLPSPLLFFFSSSLGRVLFSWQTEILVRPSLSCRTKPHSVFTHIQTHTYTPQWSGPEATLPTRWSSSQNNGEGIRSPPIHSKRTTPPASRCNYLEEISF